MRSFPNARVVATASALPAAVATARVEPAAAQAAVPRCAAPATARPRKPIRAVAASRRPVPARATVPVRATAGEGPLCRPLAALRSVFPGIGDCRGIFSGGGASSSETLLAQAP
jgi:hypothetical protein